MFICYIIIVFIIALIYNILYYKIYMEYVFIICDIYNTYPVEYVVWKYVHTVE
jgi:hypothetical protein